MNNTVLRLLKIFEEETDATNMLTKNEILDILVSEGYESINEKQFYRKIEELRNNGYNIEVKKGRQTKYFLRRDRLSREEWIFLMTLILGNKDLSMRETKHIIDALENMNVCWKSLDYFEKYKDKATTEKSKINHLKNFRLILDAIDSNCNIEYNEVKKIGHNYEISERKVMTPLDFIAEDNRIIIIGKTDNNQFKINLSSVIDVKTLC